MKREEYNLQVSVVKYLRSKGIVVFSIPNERGLGVSDAVKMRASGLTKGAPDLVAFDKKGTYWLELKAPKGTRSIEQECMEIVANDLGICYKVVRSIEDVKEFWG